MTAADQENITQKLTKIDQLLTRECLLCGDFLLDQVGAAVIPYSSDFKKVSQTLFPDFKGQNTYTIDLRTGEDKQKKLQK